MKRRGVGIEAETVYGGVVAFRTCIGEERLREEWCATDSFAWLHLSGFHSHSRKGELRSET